MVNGVLGVRLVFVGSFISDQLSLWVNFHGSQSRAFSREHSTQPLPRCQGSDHNKLHGKGSLFNFLLLKV